MRKPSSPPANGGQTRCDMPHPWVYVTLSESLAVAICPICWWAVEAKVVNGEGRPEPHEDWEWNEYGD